MKDIESVIVPTPRCESAKKTNPSVPTAVTRARSGASPSRQMMTVALKELNDRFRSGWVIVCAFVWLGAIALTSLFGLVQIGHIGVQGYERTVASLLTLVQYLVPLLALLLGHDLIVSEREDRTLPLLLASGISRVRLLLGKFLGGCLALTLPLVLGFVVAGTVIGLSAKDKAVTPFLALALSGLMLGYVLLAVGLLISTLCRTRVRALICALLTWCVVVFAFDLIALGAVVAANSTQAAHEIEAATDATHTTSIADMHQAFEGAAGPAKQILEERSRKVAAWLAVNPVDLLRAINLPASAGVAVPAWLIAASASSWLIGTLGLAAWKLRRIDL